MPTRTLLAGTAVVQAGYYAATNLTQVETELATANIRAGAELFGVPGKTEVVDTTSGNAVSAEILLGKRAWVDGAELVGSMPTQTLSPTTAAVPLGFYGATNLTQVDVDLASNNVKGGVTLFGVAGAVYAPVAKTGQLTPYGSGGDDGALKKGVTWPSPRFTVQSNTNVVRDNLTGLMWARNANLASLTNTWSEALTFCNDLNYGSYDDWRLPNVRELLSLLDYERYSPILSSGHFFDSVQNGKYWTSTTYAGITTRAYILTMRDGYVEYADKGSDNAYYVWPVRGGE
jgi:hypothetical protein